MASRKIEDLDIELQPIAENFVKVCRACDIDLLVFCTYRSVQEQNELYAAGRTAPGRILTYAKGGESLHNHAINGKPASLALDVVPLIAGKPAWSTQGEFAAIWERIGRIGKDLGLTWGGDWQGKKRDAVHFQLSD